MTPPRTHPWLLGAALALAGCPDTGLGDETSLFPRDPDLEPPWVVSISLGDLQGPPPRGVSLLPVIEVRLSETLDAATLVDDTVVLHGEGGAPVPADVALDRTSLSIAPSVPLAPLTTHRLVLAGTLRDLHGAPLADARGEAGPFEYVFETGDPSTGPPRATLVSPPEGATDVPRNVSEVIVGFTEAVFGRVRLGPYEGTCSGSDRCRIAVPAPLEPAREYSVDASDTRDTEGLAAHGAPGFTTGRVLDEEPPLLGPTPCMPWEVVVGPACADVRDVRMTIRVHTGEVSLAFVESAGRRIEGSEAGTEHRVAVTGLLADRAVTLTVGAVDAAGNEARTAALALRTLASLAPIVLTEIYADAAGAEPAQEFVEIFNAGWSDVVIEGFAIADGGGTGREFGAGAVLGAGRYGLVVADRFDPGSAEDPAVAPNTPLFRVGTSIGTNGLLNAGEPVVLLDRAGRELSRYAALLAPRSGVSAQRIAPDADEGAITSWAEDAQTGATPGAENSTGR